MLSDPRCALSENVMERIAAGDTEALGSLYDCYAGLVLALARRVLRDPTVADDLVEDVFVELWQRAGRYDATRGDLATYVATLTRSRAIDRLRSSRRSHSLRLQVGADPTATATDPSDCLIFNERAQSVTLALTALTSNQREVIGLAYYDGLSHSDIANRLNRPLGTVKTWMRQGLMRLRDELRTIVEGQPDQTCPSTVHRGISFETTVTASS